MDPRCVAADGGLWPEMKDPVHQRYCEGTPEMSNLPVQSGISLKRFMASLGSDEWVWHLEFWFECQVGSPRSSRRYHDIQ